MRPHRGEAWHLGSVSRGICLRFMILLSLKVLQRVTFDQSFRNNTGNIKDVQPTTRVSMANASTVPSFMCALCASWHMTRTDSIVHQMHSADTLGQESPPTGLCWPKWDFYAWLVALPVYFKDSMPIRAMLEIDLFSYDVVLYLSGACARSTLHFLK